VPAGMISLRRTGALACGCDNPTVAMGSQDPTIARQFDDAGARRVEAVYQTPDVVEQRRRVLEQLALQPGERVVDLGCGPGLLTVEMADAVGPTGRVDGLDASPSMLALAAPRCGSYPWVHLHAGQVTALPVEEGVFDAAVSAQVYEFVADLPLALGELARVLRPGGRALIVDTDWESCVWHSSDDERMRRVLTCWNTHCPHPQLPRILAPQLRAAGLTVVSVGVIPIVNATYDPQTYSAGALEMIADYAGRHLDPVTASAWAADLRALVARGEYFFSLNRYVFEAVASASRG
jgi:arsenite methyltransferase